jgi:zinc protease
MTPRIACLQRAASTFFLTLFPALAQQVVTLPGPPAPPLKTITLPSKSPLVTFRVVFTTGAVFDPPDKPGLANLTASMITDGGTREMTYKQVVDAFYPMAAGIGANVDKEMTTFSGSTHIDNLDAYYRLYKAMLLDPGWREEDFRRVKDVAINAIKIGLRGNNDEELGKEVLYENIYAGSPYAHLSGGSISALEKITLDDVKEFYKAQYTQANLVIGLAGGYPPAFLETMKKDFRALPAGTPSKIVIKKVPEISKTRVVIVDKDTRSVAYSIGYPIDVLRGSKDYTALLLISSYLGQHRMSSGVLYQRMREARGLNYGDYSYIEYFPRGMFLMEPQPNLGRHSQIFQVWIRPVEPPTAKFALRLALYELEKLRAKGMSKEDFENSRGFLSKNVNVLTRTKRAELGYSIDSDFYGIPQYNDYLKTELAKLTLADVNRVIKQYIHPDHAVIAVITKNGEEFKKQLVSPDPSPMKYNSPKPESITAEDKIVEKYPLGLKPEDITVRHVAEVFQ